MRTAKEEVLYQMRLYLTRLPSPEYSLSMEQLSYRSWSRTTVSYLIKEVEKTDTDPALVISEFIKKADRRSGMSFRVAYDVAVDLYDHIFL